MGGSGTVSSGAGLELGPSGVDLDPASLHPGLDPGVCADGSQAWVHAGLDPGSMGADLILGQAINPSLHGQLRTEFMGTAESCLWKLS